MDYMDYFDKSRVYTAVNADELRVGDLVVCANTLGALETAVKNEKIFLLNGRRNEDCFRRFVCNDLCYEYVYLVCPVRNVEAYRVWDEGKAVEVSFNGGKTWILFKRENDDRAPDWCIADYRPVEEKPKEKKPKEKKYRPFKNCKELLDFWYIKTAANVPSYEMPLIWVSYKVTNDIEPCQDLITGFCGNLIHIAGEIVTLQEMFEKYTFLDGTPCGVEE